MNYEVEDIAKVYSDMLGSNYYNIEVNCNFSTDNNAVQGILYAARKPFAISKMNSETLEINLEFYVNVSKKVDKLRVLETLSKILGHKTGTFIKNKEEFTYNSFLEFNRPLSAPVVDLGDYTQVILINGSCLVSGKGGGIVGNEITTTLIFNPDDESKRWEGEVAVLADVSSVVKSSESPQMANSDVAKAFNTSQTYSYTYKILLLKNRVGERLFKAAKGIEPFGQNERIDIKESFPKIYEESFSYTRELVITGITFDRQAGVFTSIQLSLQDRLNIESLEVENGE